MISAVCSVFNKIPIFVKLVLKSKQFYTTTHFFLTFAEKLYYNNKIL